MARVLQLFRSQRLFRGRDHHGRSSLRRENTALRTDAEPSIGVKIVLRHLLPILTRLEDVAIIDADGIPVLTLPRPRPIEVKNKRVKYIYLSSSSDSPRPRHRRRC